MFKDELNKMNLPAVHISEGKEYYLDPIRNQLIIKTPEEVVRQKVLQYLLSCANVPKDMIQVEMLLSKYKIESKRRADIIVEKFNEQAKLFSPLAVIECKAPDIMIGDDAINQALDYADMLLAEYVFITNGETLIALKYDAASNRYVDIQGIPSYEDMLSGKVDEFQCKEIKKRFQFDELEKNKNFYSGYEFNPNTSVHFLPFITNLWECFLDVTHKMPVKKYTIFNLVEDYGIRFLSCGNAAGGAYQGAYRSFVVQYKNTTKFMNLSFFDYGTSTILTVSVDQDNHKPHNSLQYSIDSNLRSIANKYRFVHSGRIAVGNIGSGKASELKEHIAKTYPVILKNGEIDLGTLRNVKLLYMDDQDVVAFVENLLSYALLRDEYREMVKRRGKKS